LCGNHSSCVVSYTWKVDNDAPVITGCPNAPINLGCNPTDDKHTCATALALVSANDICDGAIIPAREPGSEGVTGCLRSQDFTMTATDLCGNHSSCVVSYTWKVDKDAPVITGCPNGPIDLGCNPADDKHTCATALALVSANDICDGAII